MIEVTGNEPFDEQAEFYASLKINLDKNHNFPEDYLYKFIIVNNYFIENVLFIFGLN